MINLLFCCILLPIYLQPDQAITGKQLLEVLLWQCLALAAWPVNLVAAALSLFNQADLTAIGTLLKILIYPTGLFCMILVFILKQNKWILLILCHILLIISFWVTWMPVLRGYDFMLG